MLLLFALTSASVLNALDPTKQIDQYGHDVWTSQHGMPWEAVYQILQSPDGYLWLRTSGGLMRFDGVRFVAMDSAVSSEPVRALAMSADGDLLIRTTSRTVVYKGGNFSDYRPPLALPDGEIESLFETRRHEVLIGADDFLYTMAWNGIQLVRRGTAVVSSFLEDETGTIWVGGATAFYNYHGGLLSQAVDMSKLSAVFSIGEDHEHRIWVGASAGLYLMDRSAPGHPRLTRMNEQQIHSQVNAIVEDRSGSLWVGTSGSGLVRMHGSELSSFGAVNSLTDDRVLSIFEDREGSLWVGTASGLDRFRDTKLTTYTTKEGLPSDTTRSALLDKDGSIYVFCNVGGLARIKAGAVTATTKVPGLNNFFGSTMFQDKKGSLWLGTMGGLTTLNSGKFTVFNKDDRLSKKFIAAIDEDDESLILATSDTMAYRFKDGQLAPFTINGAMTPLSTPGNYTFAIYRDPSHTLWFGTVKGLFRFAPGQPPAAARVSQIDFPVTSISDDGRGSLWLGGRTPGLIRFRISDGRVTHYKKNDGLFDDYPTRVLYDDPGNLWISTSNGIFMANRQDMDDFADGRISTVRAVVYGIADGMKTSEASPPSSQPGGARGLDGKLWFTTAKGIVAVDPRHMMHNDLVPPVVIENVVVDDVSRPPADDLQIAAGADKIEFHYTALSLRIPDRVRFKYQLQGYDQQWVDAGSRRVAFYNNLPPGNYRFRVRGSNDDGVWNEVGASVGFELRAHFYQTRWFRALCGLAIVLIAAAGYRLNTRLFRRRAAELSRLVDERTSELRESQRHLEEVALLDSLTGLPNRRMFAQEFRKLLAAGRRRDNCFSLLMVDLDQFKQTNDTMGHDAGDALLLVAATRLKAAVRETDCVARLGGDEFAILLTHNQDQVSVDVICRRILDDFAPPEPYNGAELKTTPSIGIAVFPQHGETQEALCKSADLALYEAKRAGGNSWHWYRSQHAEERTFVS